MKRLLIFILLFSACLGSETTENSKLADEVEKNWCVAKTNILRSGYYPGGDFKTLLIDEKKYEIATLNDNFWTSVEIYFGDNTVNLLSDFIRPQFDNDEAADYEYGRLQRQVIKNTDVEFDIQNSYMFWPMMKLLFLENNETALELCKVWEDLSY